ncbi:hypothetical protein L906_17195 [Agrobacterium sp. TS45]|nr:hypothetical protein L906_17195 [Agrobacterium sp. TS45]
MIGFSFFAASIRALRSKGSPAYAAPPSVAAIAVAHNSRPRPVIVRFILLLLQPSRRRFQL